MVQKRMEALFLKSQKHKDICRICCICKTSLAKYLKDYQSGGINALLNFKGQSSELSSHATSIEEYFREHPPQNTEGYIKVKIT